MTKHFIFTVFCLVMTVLLLPAGLRAAELRSLEVISDANDTTVTLRLSEPSRYAAHQLPATASAAKRCYVDLYSTTPSNTLPNRRALDNPHIQRIRTGIHGTMLRVVLDLQPQGDCVIDQPDSTRVRLRVSGPAPSETARPKSRVTQTELADTLRELPKALEQTKTEVPDPAKQPSSDGSKNGLLIVSADQNSASASAASTSSDLLLGQGRQGFSNWGRLQAWGATDLDDDGAEDNHLSQFNGRAGVGWDGRARADLDVSARLSAEIRHLAYANDQADNDTEVDLRQASLQFSAARWDLSLGKQRLRWGKSDQLSPLDSLNPMDMRRFMLPDLEDRALTSWLGRLRWLGDRLGVEAVVSPWFEESELDYFDSDWALYRNLRQSILEHPTLPAEAKAYAANLRVRETEPSDTLENMSGALRLSWRTSSSDFALSYRYGWETLPTITSFPVKNIDYNGDPSSDPAALLAPAVLTDEAVEAGFERQRILGFEWETVLDPVGFRGEIAYLDDVAFLATDLTSERREALHLVSGIDYTSVSEWYFNLQASWYRIFDYADSILYFEEDNVALLGEISKPLWRGNLEALTRFNYNITDASSYLQPALKIKYFTNVEAEVGANIFSGDGDTLLGSYDQADQVYAQLTFSF